MLTRRHDTAGRAPLPRCCLVWLGVTAAAIVLVRALVPGLHDAPALATAPGRAGVPFDAALAAGCAAVLVGCLAWAWLATTAVLLEAATGLRAPRGVCPAAWRRLVLATCGVALVAAAPATAAPSAGIPRADGGGGVAAAHGRPSEDRSVLAGLPVPDRATGGVRSPGPADPSPAGEVRVRAGDTLWDLAARSLPADADPAAIAGACTRLWRANRAVVGDDPDLIRPGTILRLPPRKDA